MKNMLKAAAGPNQESEKLRREVNSGTPGHEPKKVEIYQDTEKDLTAKILKITMMIKEQFPELSKYLEEMPVTIPNKENPKLVLEELKKYYDSLHAMLNKYKLESRNQK